MCFYTILHNICIFYYVKKIDFVVKFLYNKNMKKQKLSNEIYTPRDAVPKKKISKAKIFFYIWNIFSIVLFSSYTMFVIYRMTEKTFLSHLITYLLYAYAAIFILIIILNLKNRKKLKNKLKNYQSATNFLKYVVQIINFILSISTAISALFSTGNLDINTIGYGLLSIFVALVMIIIEIAKIIIRKNLPLIKYNFLEMRDKVETYESTDNE